MWRRATGRSIGWRGVAWAAVAGLVCGGAAGAAVQVERAGGAPDTRGFLYGKVTSRNGTVYQGRLRWDDEEASWGDHFNGTKHDRPYLRQVPERARRRREPIRILGITIGMRWDDADGGRQFIARFGDIARIEMDRGEAVLTMKNGSRYTVEGGSNDIGADISVWDAGLGRIDLPWKNVETVEFLPTPADLPVAEHRLYGTVTTTDGEFRGFVQWDQDEALSGDVLDGDTRDGAVKIPMGRIRTLERRTRSSSRVILADGRDLVLDDSNDVDSDNRGVFIDDPRFGRVLVPWEEFERLELAPPADSGPPYASFAPGAPLRGTVTTVDGESHRGRLVYDLDESESWEMLGGEWRGIEYFITFDRIAAVVPRSRHSSRIVLKNGEELELEDSADVGEGNAGILVLDARGTDPVYVPWEEVKRVDFE